MECRDNFERDFSPRNFDQFEVDRLGNTPINSNKFEEVGRDRYEHILSQNTAYNRAYHSDNDERTFERRRYSDRLDNPELINDKISIPIRSALKQRNGDNHENNRDSLDNLSFRELSQLAKEENRRARLTQLNERRIVGTITEDDEIELCEYVYAKLQSQAKKNNFKIDEPPVQDLESIRQCIRKRHRSSSRNRNNRGS